MQQGGGRVVAVAGRVVRVPPRAAAAQVPLEHNRKGLRATRIRQSCSLSLIAQACSKVPP